MFHNKFTSITVALGRVFKTEDSRFIISVGLKISSISLFISLTIYFYIMQIMKLNYAFFKAHGLPDIIDQNLFLDYIVGEAMDNLPMLFAFQIILFFLGTYFGWLILKPFREIGEYCEEVLENPNAVFGVSEFSAHRLLARFSEFFFEYLRESKKRGQIISNSIPPRYSKIHRPVADKIFMLHFTFLMIIISISSAIFIIDHSSSVFNSMIELSMKIFSDHKISSRYFSEQSFILNDIVIITVVFTVISYILLGIHLYSKVSGAAFGVFSTMRSFMKGNLSSRVHLVGYGYLRDYTRKINKYLDHIENNLTKHPGKD